MPAIGADRIRELLSSGNGIAGSFAEQGYTARRIADEHHPTGGPPGHINAGDRIEIHVLGGMPGLEEAFGEPSIPGVCGVDQAVRLLWVVMVEGLRAAEDECGAWVTAGGVDGQRPSWAVVQEDFLTAGGNDVGTDRADEQAHGVRVLGLWTERESPHGGVHAIRP